MRKSPNCRKGRYGHRMAAECKRTRKGIWSGVRRWRGDVRKQYESSVTCYNFTRAIAAPSITTAEWYCLRIASKVAVAAENGVPTVAIGNDNDIGFVISRA